MLEQREIDRWRRLTDAMLRHAAEDDPEAFAQVVNILDRAQAKLPAVADHLRHGGLGRFVAPGPMYSWADLAQALRVTRSAVQQRFGAHRITVRLHD